MSAFGHYNDLWPLKSCDIMMLFVYSPGSPVLVNGEEFENIEIQPLSAHHHSNIDNGHGTVITTGRHPLQMDQNRNTEKSSNPNKCDIIITGSGKGSDSVMSSNSDVMHQIVKNKDLFSSGKRFSVDSEQSEASTLMSSSSETVGEEEGRKRINHHSIRSTLSDSEMEMSGVRNLYSMSPFFSHRAIYCLRRGDW